jgi:hypothetical protein
MMGRLTVIDLGCNMVALRRLPRGRRRLSHGERLIRAGSVPGGKQLTLPVRLNGVAGIATLDTGARETSINRRFAAAAGLDLQSRAFHAGEAVHGATNGTMVPLEGMVGSVSFGGLVRKNVSARIIDLPAFKEMGWADRPAMNLGVDLLKGARLSVDYAGRRIWLAPSACEAMR